MERSDEQRRTRERFLAALAEATYPLQQNADDRDSADDGGSSSGN